MEPIVSLHKITKNKKQNKMLLLNYFQKEVLLNKISFRIYKGETIGLVGESGSGKSVLGKILVNLLKPDSGHIYYKDKDFSELDLRYLKKKLQIVFQNPKSILNLKMTVFKIISEPIISHKLYKNKSEILNKVNKLMDEVHLDKSYINLLAEDLNLIDLKRIMFARVLSLNPEFIVIDELLSEQDAINLNITIDLIKKIKRTRNITILIISSNLKLILSFIDRLAIFYKGNLVELIPKSRFEEKGLHPYTELLFNKNENDIDNIDNYLQILKKKRNRLENRCVFLDRCNVIQDICYNKKPKFKEIENKHFISCLLYDE